MLIPLLGLLGFVGCADVAFQSENLRHTRKLFREPGETLVTHPTKIFEEYECATRALPMVEVETNAISPPTLRAGDNLKHRVTYAYCPERQSEVLPGSITRRILYRGAVVLERQNNDFEFSAGRWVVDRVIEVPRAASAGIYSLEVIIAGSGVDYTASESFVVEPPKP